MFHQGDATVSTAGGLRHAVGANNNSSSYSRSYCFNGQQLPVQHEEGKDREREREWKRDERPQANLKFAEARSELLRKRY